MRVNAGELSRLLKVSRSTLGKWITDFGDDFPAIERGGQGREWLFESADVVAFLETRKAEEEAKRTARDEQLAQLILPVPASAREGRDDGVVSLDARLKAERLNALRIENARRAGDLVPVAEIKEVLFSQIRAFGREQDAMMRTLAREHGLPGPVAAVMEQTGQKLRHDFVRKIEAELRRLQTHVVPAAGAPDLLEEAAAG
jgi:phage terminase Nu1 subunit (DNA packaging protein)